jgi:Abortive infection C-terminus
VKDLISSSTRGQFRQLMTDSTVASIGAAFHDAGFAPNPDCSYDDSSVRRSHTQAYLEAVDWSDPGHVDRACRVFERLLTGWSATPELRAFYHSLIRDGCTVDFPGTGIITPPTDRGPLRPWRSLATVRDPTAIQEQLDRIQRAVIDDPALAIGSAKELVESTAKCVLLERGRPINDRDDLPALARAAQEALGLHPSSSTPGPDGSDAVRRILGAVTTITSGLGELRNRGYGTGHGPAGARVGLRPRHAHLAVNAAITWCQLLLDTLSDPEAPWRRTPDSPNP